MCENILLQNIKNDFLADEFFMLSWNAAVEHNKTWNNLKKKSQKREFRKKIKSELQKMLMSYSDKKVDEKTHYNNIEHLRKITEENGEGFDIGKRINLKKRIFPYSYLNTETVQPVRYYLRAMGNAI